MVVEHEFLTLYTTTIASSSSVFFFFRIDQLVAILAYQVVQKKEWDLQFDSKALLQIPKLQFLSEECENCSNIVKVIPFTKLSNKHVCVCVFLSLSLSLSVIVSTFYHDFLSNVQSCSYCEFQLLHSRSISCGFCSCSDDEVEFLYSKLFWLSLLLQDPFHFIQKSDKTLMIFSISF
jgi:hypothetical protein